VRDPLVSNIRSRNAAQNATIVTWTRRGRFMGIDRTRLHRRRRRLVLQRQLKRASRPPRLHRMRMVQGPDDHGPYLSGIQIWLGRRLGKLVARRDRLSEQARIQGSRAAERAAAPGIVITLCVGRELWSWPWLACSFSPSRSTKRCTISAATSRRSFGSPLGLGVTQRGGGRFGCRRCRGRSLRSARWRSGIRMRV